MHHHHHVMKALCRRRRHRPVERFDAATQALSLSGGRSFHLAMNAKHECQCRCCCGWWPATGLKCRPTWKKLRTTSRATCSGGKVSNSLRTSPSSTTYTQRACVRACVRACACVPACLRARARERVSVRRSLCANHESVCLLAANPTKRGGVVVFARACGMCLRLCLCVFMS